MIKGKVTVKFGDDINTDYIIPAPLLQESWDNRFFAEKAFAYYDPTFVPTCRANEDNIVVAGKNFGCGSSREQAVYAIQYNNVKAVIAVSFPDIFYRNSLNNGLPVLKVDDVSNMEKGDELEIDFGRKVIKNLTRNLTYQIIVSDTDLSLLAKGGLLGMARARLRERLAKLKVQR